MKEVTDVSKKKSKLKIILLILIPILILILASYFLFFSKTTAPPTSQQIQQVQADIQMQNVTPSVVAYLLNQLGVSSLHKNPVTREKPIICVKIDGKEYYTTIDNAIQIQETSCTNQDIDIVCSKQEVLNVVLSSDPKLAVKESVSSGKTQLNILSSQSNLFAKGYLSVYNSLK